MPSSAFLVVADGAVVAAWGDVGRRFMGHSVRKSFLSALYGIYWDRGQIELDKTLADLGIDDCRVLSQHWVQQSSALYSIDTDIMGYGFYWWILRQPPFLDHGMYAALGVGNQMIACCPSRTWSS